MNSMFSIFCIFSFSTCEECQLQEAVDLKQLVPVHVHLRCKVQGQGAAANRPLTRARALASGSMQGLSESTLLPSENIAGTNEVVKIVDVDDVDVGSKRKFKSNVWEEFDRARLNGVMKAKCMWCKKHLGGETRKGTNHLRGHIEICPDRAVRKGLKQSTPKLSANPQDGIVRLEK